MTCGSFLESLFDLSVAVWFFKEEAPYLGQLHSDASFFTLSFLGILGCNALKDFLDDEVHSDDSSGVFIPNEFTRVMRSWIYRSPWSFG